VSDNEDHRAKMDRLRRWEADQRRAEETQALQRAAAARKRTRFSGNVWVSRAGVVLMVLGGGVALVHMLRHLAASPRGLEDITAGYPAAAVVFVLGLIMVGTR